MTVALVFLTKLMSMKAVRTSWWAMQWKQLVTGLGHKTQNTQNNNSHKASVHMYPTDDYSGNTTQQTCTKPLSLSSTCLYHTDGPDFATGPHTLPTKLSISQKMGSIYSLY